MPHNKIFIISGASGAGKGTIIEALRKIPELNLVWAKSYTTRPERKSDEIENKYIFVDEKKFKVLEKSGEIIESNFYNNRWYGSSRSEIEKTISEGKNVIKDIDVNGGLYYKKTFPDAVLIFIKSDLDDIKKRLISRGQNSVAEIKDRLATAQKELPMEKEYNYSIINPEGQVEKAVIAVSNIIIKSIS